VGVAFGESAMAGHPGSVVRDAPVRVSNVVVLVGMELPRFISIDRVRSSHRAPSSAQIVTPSTTAHDQRRFPWLPISSSTARLSRRHGRGWVHLVTQRRAVGTVTLKLGRACRQALPMLGENQIAVNTPRASTRDSRHRAVVSSPADQRLQQGPKLVRHEVPGRLLCHAWSSGLLAPRDPSQTQF
jgi:hypothetical protein